LNVSTGSRRCCLPVIEFNRVRKFADFGQELALLETVFDRATERHAALVFLLTTGSGGAAFFVGLGHVETPKTYTGALR
jgi:hypothetical protein